MLAVTVCIHSLYHIEVQVLLFLVSLRPLSGRDVGFCQKPHLMRWFLYFIYMLYSIYWFPINVSPLHTDMKPTWYWYMILIMCCQIWFKSLCISIKKIIYSFWCVHYWFCYLSNIRFAESVGTHFNFLWNSLSVDTIRCESILCQEPLLLCQFHCFLLLFYSTAEFWQVTHLFIHFLWDGSLLGWPFLAKNHPVVGRCGTLVIHQTQLA